MSGRFFTMSFPKRGLHSRGFRGGLRRRRTQPVTDGFGHMRAADCIGSLQICNCPSHPHHAVIPSRRQAKLLRYLEQKFTTSRFWCGKACKRLAFGIGIEVHPWNVGIPLGLPITRESVARATAQTEIVVIENHGLIC